MGLLHGQRVNSGDVMRASTLKSLCWASVGLVAMVLAGLAPAQEKQNQASMPRGPIKTPLGITSTEVLFSKITVSNVRRSYLFYTQIIGLRTPIAIAQKEAPPPPGEDPASWPAETALSFSGSFDEPFFDILPPRNGMLTRDMTDKIVIGLKVADAPAVIKRAKDAGYEVLREAPVVGPGEMSIGMVRDPDGYRVEILQAASYPRQ